MDRAIQRGYLRIWLTVSAVFAVAVAGTAFFAWWVLARTTLHPYYLETLSNVLRANAVLLILVTLFMGLYTVLLSHRITGPTWRIQEALRRATDERHYSEMVDLTDHDYLQAVAEDLNRLLRQLSGDQRRVGGLGASLKAIAVELETIQPRDAESLARLREEIARLGGKLERLGQPVAPLKEEPSGEEPEAGREK